MIWLKRVLTVVVVAFVLFFVVGLLLPRTFEHETEIVIAAPAATIHDFVSDLERWPDWMPFYADPELEITRGETTRGVDANQTWQDAGGQGSVTLTASDPEAGIAYDLSMVDGRVVGTSSVSYAGVDADDDTPAAEWTSTLVTWRMEGNYGDLVTRWMGMLMSRKTNGQLAEGLTSLQDLAETDANPEETDKPE